MLRKDGLVSQGLAWHVGSKNGLEGQVSLTALGLLVKKWLEGAGFDGLTGRVDLMGTGQCGRIGG